MPPIAGEDRAARSDPGVVHQHGDRAEGRVAGLLQRLDFGELADVGRRGEHALRAVRRSGGDFARRVVESLAGQIGDDDVEPHRRESFAAARPMPEAPPVTTAQLPAEKGVSVGIGASIPCLRKVCPRAPLTIRS